MKNNYDLDNVSRLAGLVIENNPLLADKGVEGYEDAVEKLKSFTLCLLCGEEIASSQSLQAALITAVNTAKRAFQGGVTVVLKENFPFLLPWSEKTYLNQVIAELGGQVKSKCNDDFSFTLTFGEKAKEDNSLQVICNGWIGGVCTYDKPVVFEQKEEFVLGGILAGSLGVGLAFIRVSGEKIDVCSKNTGLSLWKPNVNWLESEAVGPKVTYLPQKYWFVGLGHLGQAFVWTLGLLPFTDPSKVSVTIQDTERVSISNLETGLLSDKSNISVKKTRVCSKWLEERKISTSIIEKKFNVYTYPDDGECSVLIRGLDSTKSRKEIDLEKFSFVIDCGIGGTKNDFDSISIFNFPEYEKKPESIWDDGASIINKINEKAMNFLGCGVYGKTISTSFVGAFASTLVFAELIKAGYQGMKISSMTFSIRNLENESNISSKKNYSRELSGNGFV